MCIPILVTSGSAVRNHCRTPPAPCVRPRCVCSVFCVHMYSFAGLIRRTPPPTFIDTAITDRHPDTTIFQLRAHWVRISWSIGSEKSFGHVPPVKQEFMLNLYFKFIVLPRSIFPVYFSHMRVRLRNNKIKNYSFL